MAMKKPTKLRRMIQTRSKVIQSIQMVSEAVGIIRKICHAKDFSFHYFCPTNFIHNEQGSVHKFAKQYNFLEKQKIK